MTTKATITRLAGRIAPTLSGLALLTLVISSPAQAHVVHGDTWAVTLRDLTTLYPAADPNAWKIQRYAYSDEQTKVLAKALGFELYPQDRSPEFFIAHDSAGALLGVAMFIDARAQPKIVNGEAVPLHVGVGVNAKGEINAVHVYDYDGPAGLTQAPFLDQLLGRNARCTFATGKRALTPVPEALEDSQLIANAGREALVLMATALGSEAELPPCPIESPAPAKKKRRFERGPVRR